MANETLALQLELDAPMNDFRFQPKGFRSDLGWYTRGYIPNFESRDIAQFFTFRLHDSLRGPVVERWRQEAPDQS